MEIQETKTITIQHNSKKISLFSYLEAELLSLLPATRR